MSAITLALLCLFLYHVASRAIQLYKALKSIGFYPGDRWLFSDMRTPMRFILPCRIPYVSPGKAAPGQRVYSDYKRHGCDVISQVSVYPIQTSFLIADPDIIHKIASARHLYPKPIDVYEVLNIYGPSILVSEGEEWKRYRKIANPSFSERNNSLVWEESQRIMLELLDEEWRGQETVIDENILITSTSVTLFVISSAVFGQRISWKDEGLRSAGFDFSFKETMYHASTHIFAKVGLPEWLLKLGITSKLRTTYIAFELMERYLLEMVQQRENAEVKVERHDLLSGLLDATDEEFSGYRKLTDREVLSNIFIFLMAGHETTANTLAFTLILLALYPEEQKRLYEQCKSVLGDNEIPKYEDMSSYTYAMAVFYETLRLFPPVSAIPKVAAEDSVLYATNAVGEKIPIVVPKGTDLLLHVMALHQHPKYWENPTEFQPSRFMKPDWPRDAFIPFSEGMRSCIGRRFAEVEVVAVLTLLSLKFEIEVKVEPQFAGESFEQRKARLLSWDGLLTLTPGKVPLVFHRRK
ncbi:cytochrome P450 [Trametopsis cervina]|nr:cytochrome P450 [Trametopsis cervina]